MREDFGITNKKTSQITRGNLMGIISAMDLEETRITSTSVVKAVGRPIMHNATGKKMPGAYGEKRAKRDLEQLREEGLLSYNLIERSYSATDEFYREVRYGGITQVERETMRSAIGL